MSKKKYCLLIGLKIGLIALCCFSCFLLVHKHIIEISDSLGFLSLILIGCSLIESIRQRTTSYKPKILLIQKTSLLQCDKNGIPALWKDKPEDFYSEEMNCATNRIFIELYNAGIGPAIDITCTWKIGRKKIRKMFTEMSQSYKDLIEYNEENDSVTIKSNNTPDSYHTVEYKLFQNDEKTTIKLSSIPPFSNGQTVSIELPDSFSLLLSVFSYAKLVEEKEQETNLLGLLELELSYYDTGEKIYKDSKKIDFKFTSLYDGKILYNEKSYIDNTNYGLCHVSRQ